MSDRPAGWIIACHRRTGCPSLAWLPNAGYGSVVEIAQVPIVAERLKTLQVGWRANFWDLHHTRILALDERVTAARPHYFCSDTCRSIGCGSCPKECSEAGWCDDEAHSEIARCKAWGSSFEVSQEIAEQIVAAGR